MLLLDVRGVDNKLETVTLTEISGSALIPCVLWSSGPADICGFCECHRQLSKLRTINDRYNSVWFQVNFQSLLPAPH